MNSSYGPTKIPNQAGCLVPAEGFSIIGGIMNLVSCLCLGFSCPNFPDEYFVVLIFLESPDEKLSIQNYFSVAFFEDVFLWSILQQMPSPHGNVPSTSHASSLSNLPAVDASPPDIIPLD